MAYYENLNENFKLSRYENSFIWLKDAGVALPTFCASEPTVPLLLSKSTNLFKLFLPDVGLLSAMYANGIQMKMLMNELNINYGAIYENKSGKDYERHAALNNCMKNPQYDILKAYVFCNENVKEVGDIIYYPVYMISFLHKESEPEDMIYKLDLCVLM